MCAKLLGYNQGSELYVEGFSKLIYDWAKIGQDRRGAGVGEGMV